MNNWWFIIIGPLGVNFIEIWIKYKIFIQENAFEYVICKMGRILFRASENGVHQARRAEAIIFKWMNEWKKHFGLQTLRWSRNFFSDALILFRPQCSYFQILLDGPGVLKFAGFGLSRVEGENLEELFTQFADSGETPEEKGDDQDSDTPKKFKTLGENNLFNFFSKV